MPEVSFSFSQGLTKLCRTSYTNWSPGCSKVRTTHELMWRVTSWLSVWLCACMHVNAVFDFRFISAPTASFTVRIAPLVLITSNNTKNTNKLIWIYCMWIKRKRLNWKHACFNFKESCSVLVVQQVWFWQTCNSFVSVHIHRWDEEEERLLCRAPCRRWVHLCLYSPCPGWNHLVLVFCCKSIFFLEAEQCLSLCSY